MAAARAFGMESMDSASADGRQGILNESGLIEGVAVQRDLHVHFVGHRQRAVDCRRGRAPVFVNFQADNPGRDLLTQRVGIRAVAFTQ